MSGVLGPHPSPSALASILSLPLSDLMAAARTVRDRRPSNRAVITFSPKVFLPLTRLCRDRCGYCTFAIAPPPGRRAYMTLEELVTLARQGKELGCTEALFTLGDKPELRYAEARTELAEMGLRSTAEYVALAAGHVFRETGLLPHVNAGVLTEDELKSLRAVSVSQGLMLESLAERLLEVGQAHADSPDKDPRARLGTIEAAGRLGIPFTSGVLIGIGETRAERLEALLALRDVHERHGHIQELIIQNFRAKKGTRMEHWPEPSLEELLWTVSVCRLAFGPSMAIQVPPNLTPEADDAGSAAAELSLTRSWRALLDAGISDWGGVSPVTRDFVNPEKPWPHLGSLARATAEAGFHLVPRLPIYAPFALAPGTRWMDEGGGAASIAGVTRTLLDGQGLLRGHRWAAGQLEAAATAADSPPLPTPGDQDTEAPRTASSQVEFSAPPSVTATAPALKSHTPPVRLDQRRLWRVAMDDRGELLGLPDASPRPFPEVQSVLERILADPSHPSDLTESELTMLFEARGADYTAVCAAADRLRRHTCGEEVTYVVNRNINYTNVCTYSCTFCAFSKGKSNEELRGPAYLVDLAEIERRTAEAWDRGATEVCMQGGIHPDFTGQTYLDILAAAKRGAPDMHVHAFSPLEVSQGAATLGRSVRSFLQDLQAAGLGSLPGTAAEVLDDGVRSVLCPDKLSAGEWITVVRTAHEVGLKTTSTIMFGHCDESAAWARHLTALRALQRETGGITEFVPLPFVHMEAPLFLRGRARPGPTLREAVLMHAVGRLALHGHVRNVQASWVKMGPGRVGQLLAAGCNDAGGVLMNESITRAAGAAHGQALSVREMTRLIAAEGRVAVQRTTLYGRAAATQVDKSFREGGRPLGDLQFSRPF